MSLPDMGIRLVVENLPGFEGAMKTVDDATKKATDSLEGGSEATAKAGDEADKAAPKFGLLGRVFGEGGAASKVMAVAVEGATAAVAAAAAAAVLAFNALMEMNAAMAGTEARTGTTGKALDQFRQDTLALSRTGLEDTFDAASRVVERTRTQLDFINKGEIPEFERAAAGVGKAWGVAGESVVDTIDGVLDKFNDLKGKPLDALNSLTQAAQASHLPLQTIQGIVERNGSTFAAAGLSADEMFGIIAKSGDIGIDQFRALTTGVDALHQKFIKPPAGFEKALKELSLGTTTQLLKENRISFGNALDAIYTQLGSIKDPAEADAIAMQLFGTSIDKIGGTQALAKLAGFPDALDKTRNAATAAANVMEDDGTLGTAIKKAGANIKATFEQAADDIFHQLQGIAGNDPFHNILSAAGQTASELPTVLGAAVSQPFNDLFADLGQKFQLIGGLIQAQFSAFGGNVKTALSVVSATIDGFIEPIKTSISNLVTSATSTWNEWFGPGGKLSSLVGSAIESVVNSIRSKPGDIGNAISAITSAVQGVWDGLFGPSGSLAGGVNSALQSVVDAANGIVGAVSNAFGAIAKAATDALAPILSFLQKIVDAVNSALAGISKLGGSGGGGGSIPGASGGLPHFKAGGTPDLDQGITVVGEEGPEVISRVGNKVSIISNQQSRSLLGQAAGSTNSAAVSAAVDKLAGFATDMANAARVLTAVITQPVGAVAHGGSSSISNNNMTINMNGVKGGSDAVRRFSTLNAMRKV